MLNKTFYRIVLLVSFLGINALVIWGISSVLSYLNTGADRSTMLHREVAMKAVYLPKVEWENLENPGRPMELPTLAAIEKDYLSAWHVRNMAFMNNDRYGISDYYTDSARVRLYEQIDLNLAQGNWFKNTTLEHHPELDFYSEDGTLVVFTDHHVSTYQEVYNKEELLFQHRNSTSFQVLMLLEDGFWRIRHLKELPKPSKTEVTAEKTKRLLQKIPPMKGVNYYPRDTPWDTFGPTFNDSIVNSDFERLRQMGLNTVRIFVQYEDFGGAIVPPEKIALLQELLSLAGENDLQVVVTLFDFYGDYDVPNWTLTHRHAETIVNALKEHPALLGWDIKNEPDLDFESRGEQRVTAWLREMVTAVQKWDALHPVTIGWSSPEAAVVLAEEVDYVSFHYYREVDEFKAAYSVLKEAVNTKPLVLQEYGYSSYDGIWNAFLGSEESQAMYYKQMQALLKKEELPFLFWGFHDFKEIPTEVVGRLPWRKARQKYFGILDTEGKPKEAYPYLDYGKPTP